MNPFAASTSFRFNRRIAFLASTFIAALTAACGATPGDESVASESSALTVGGGSGPANAGSDWSATVSGTIATAVGSFPSVTGVTSETDSNANNYMLQMNSQSHFTTPQTTALCSPNGVAIPGCNGWQQFFLSPRTTTGANGSVVQTGRIYIEYWLLGYNAPAADGGPTCPPGWLVGGVNQCKLDSPETTTPFPSITNLATITLTAGAGASDTLTVTIGGVPYAIPPQPSVLGLNTVWNTAEFNVFGNLDGSNAVFNSGSTITVQTLVTSATPTTAAPGCSESSTTAETSNLNLNTSSCTPFGGSTPGILFTETNVVGGACGANSVVNTADVCVVVGSSCADPSELPNYIWDSAGACVAVASACGTTTGDIINAAGQCVGIGSTCGPSSVISTAGGCVVVASSCTDPGGPPNTYIWDAAGACVAVGSACGTTTGDIIDSSGQCASVGTACAGANTVLTDLGFCATIGSGCAINGDVAGTWNASGECWAQNITCPAGSVVAGPIGGEYCAPASSSNGGTVHSGSGGGGVSSGGGGGGSTGGGCPKCVKIQ